MRFRQPHSSHSKRKEIKDRMGDNDRTPHAGQCINYTFVIIAIYHYFVILRNDKKSFEFNSSALHVASPLEKIGRMASQANDPIPHPPDRLSFHDDRPAIRTVGMLLSRLRSLAFWHGKDVRLRLAFGHVALEAFLCRPFRLWVVWIAAAVRTTKETISSAHHRGPPSSGGIAKFRLVLAATPFAMIFILI